MIDIRPVTYVIGLLTAAMGMFMVFPMALDFALGDPHWLAFCESAIICVVFGGAMALASAESSAAGLSLQQVFLLTTGVWIVLPAAGSLPLILGEPGLHPVDALFEAISGITTTGTTVIEGLDSLPRGTNLWRGILQWLGGLGIVIVAMLFLPVMKVGGMQYFRSESFDTLGKVLPRALDISAALIQIYVWLTVSCAVTYFALGMTGFDAVVHAMTTVSTGGFSTSDRSFAVYQGLPEYAAVVFMILGSLPFVRFIQLTQGSIRPLLRDAQVRAYLRWNLYAAGTIIAYEFLTHGFDLEPLIRETLFNVVSTFSGTGFASVDLSSWGPYPFAVLIVVGLIGGCTSSTGCSVKVFRYLILFEAIKVQIRQLLNPTAITRLRYDDRPVSRDVVDSVVVFFTLFILSFGLLAVALSMTGLETKTAVTAAWTSIANVGPVFGPEVGPTGSVDGFSTMAKLLMMSGMLIGRLELLSVYVLFMRRFWRN